MATKKHNEKAELINEMTRELEGLQGPKTEIRIALLKTTLKISNWKTLGHDGIHGYWFQKFIFIHNRLTLEMNRCLQRTHVPEWMTKGRTIWIKKDPNKETAQNNYRPITCLPMMWKILTAQIRGKIYYSLTSRGLFPDEQKGCDKGYRGTGELLYIDQHISKNQTENVAMAWSEYKKVIWYGSTKLDNKLPQNVQTIRGSHRLYQENHENLEIGIDSRRKKFNWSKDPNRYFSRRCTTTVTIHYCHEAT